MGSSLDGPNIHYLGTAMVQVKSVSERKRGGINEKRTFRKSKLVTKIISIHSPGYSENEIFEVARVSALRRILSRFSNCLRN